MKSKLWINTYSDITTNPIDSESEQLFLKEALLILDEIYNRYKKYQAKFNLDDCSLEKAIWMLHLDALDTLKDCINLLGQKKYKIVGKLFRDIFETIDLSYFFWEERNKGSKNLKKWYNYKIIPHKKFRKYVEKTKEAEYIKEGEEIIVKVDGEIVAKIRGGKITNKIIDKKNGEIIAKVGGKIIAKEGANIYKALSEWVHHTYRILKYSYSLVGKNEKMLIYDGYSDNLISPQIILQYTWNIKESILHFLGTIRKVGLINWEEIRVLLNKTIHGLEFK